MRSLVSRRALGECNAITSRGFGPSELTFVSALETEFGASHKPVSEIPTLPYFGGRVHGGDILLP